jgi:chromosome segregation ATPase
VLEEHAFNVHAIHQARVSNLDYSIGQVSEQVREALERAVRAERCMQEVEAKGRSLAGTERDLREIEVRVAGEAARVARERGEVERLEREVENAWRARTQTRELDVKRQLSELQTLETSLVDRISREHTLEAKHKDLRAALARMRLLLTDKEAELRRLREEATRKSHWIESEVARVT